MVNVKYLVVLMAVYVVPAHTLTYTFAEAYADNFSTCCCCIFLKNIFS